MNPDKSLFVLDSYALLAYLGGESGADRVEKILTLAGRGECDLLLCMINFGEVLYMTERRRGLAAAQSAQALIEGLPVDLLEVTRNLVLDAAHIKAQYALSYADAFVVAVARQENATVLTADPEFHAVEEMVKIEWLK